MNFFHILILSVVEGVTEFLPVSSTFHLIWTGRLLQLPNTEFLKLFQVVIQSGAIMAVVALYFQKVLQNRQLFQKVIVSFIPTAIVGFMLYSLIKSLFFETLLFTTSVFIIVGVIFIALEMFIQNKEDYLVKEENELSYRDAVIIGVIQSLAVVPGVSRAGSVIAGMMLMKYKRDFSAVYSFLLAVPTILAASGFDLLENHTLLFSERSNIQFIVLGIVLSYMFALIAVKWLIGYLQRHTLVLFGWYRIVLGIILLGTLFI